MDELTSLALTVLQGAFHGPDLPDWVRQRLDDGLGSICLFGSNVEDVDQLATLTGRLHAVRPDVITATDEEGGSEAIAWPCTTHARRQLEGKAPVKPLQATHHRQDPDSEDGREPHTANPRVGIVAVIDVKAL